MARRLLLCVCDAHHGARHISAWASAPCVLLVAQRVLEGPTALGTCRLRCDLQVSVATSLEAPIKLLFPRVLEEGSTRAPFSMLGLGDIVIPGIFVALILRYDATVRKYASTYFWRCALPSTSLSGAARHACSKGEQGGGELRPVVEALSQPWESGLVYQTTSLPLPPPSPSALPRQASESASATAGDDAEAPAAVHGWLEMDLAMVCMHACEGQQMAQPSWA